MSAKDIRESLERATAARGKDDKQAVKNELETALKAGALDEPDRYRAAFEDLARSVRE